MNRLKFRLLAMLFVAFALGLTMTSCEEDDNIKESTDTKLGDNIVINENISENTTWTNDNVYQLGGRIAVLDGVTLTIEPGTIIKGEAGNGVNATALLIARGATIMAEGRADAPIIFTSVADEISPEDVAAGNFGSPNLDPDIDGLWGGVLVLGHAPISASNESGDVSEIQIEGIPTSDANGLYGGNREDDSSGILKYISIRHGGANIGAGNEINGLTLGGVGNGTVVENIEVVSNQDDGIEWFGGTVNVSNAMVWNVNDDAIDADQSWAGTLDNFMVLTPGDNNFELDGPEGSYDAGYTIKNGIVSANKDERSSNHLIDIDANTIAYMESIYITDINEGQTVAINPHEAPGVSFGNIFFDVEEANLSDYVKGDEVPDGIEAGQKPEIADKSVFGWTWASQYGAY